MQIVLNIVCIPMADYECYDCRKIAFASIDIYENVRFCQLCCISMGFMHNLSIHDIYQWNFVENVKIENAFYVR